MTQKKEHFPLLILLAFSLLIGILTFQDYGMTWDERLYYQYGESIGYAYSIPARFSPDFDINRAYGPSIGDHRNRGPAYLLLARLPVNALHTLTQIDKVALWHLINFITYLIGVLYLYKLALRWLPPKSAFGAALLYISQPLLWGHAFINPKDPPFTTLFLAALYHGFILVDTLSTTEASQKSKWSQTLLVGALIGLATNLRIIAPLLGVILFLYALTKKQPKILLRFIPLALIALLTVYLSWPYLWDAPISRFIEVLTLMSHNPTGLKVLFYGNIYRAYELPLRYLPVLMGITLTEPTWILFGIGLIAAFFQRRRGERARRDLGALLFYFGLVVSYVLIIRPPMYDGYRHFLFLLPPVFIFAGFALDFFFSHIQPKWLHAAILLGILSLGVSEGIRLHPYEYTYYNAFVNGTAGAEGKFETDYWLTCYKDALENFSELFPQGATLVVPREAENARYYARPNITVVSPDLFKKGNYLLLSARLNAVNSYHKYPDIVRIEKNGATFCLIKKITD